MGLAGGGVHLQVETWGLWEWVVDDAVGAGGKCGCGAAGRGEVGS